MKEMLKTPDMDVTTIKVGLKLSTQKHSERYEFFKTENGNNVIRSVFHFTGIIVLFAKLETAF